MGYCEWWANLDEEIKFIILLFTCFTSFVSIIPFTALGVTLSRTDDDDNGYAAANATYYYNITATNTTSTSVEYLTGVDAKLLRHFFYEECLEIDDKKYKRTAKVRADACEGLWTDGGGERAPPCSGVLTPSSGY